MFGLLTHFCQKAFQSLTFDTRRSTSPLIPLNSTDGRNSSLEEEREPIVQQPKVYRRKRTDSVESETSGTQEVSGDKLKEHKENVLFIFVCIIY